MNIEIKNGRVIDPKNGIDRQNTSLFVAEGTVVGLGQVPAGFVADKTIDASGCVVCPGLIDLGARLNSIEAELAAAVAGGVTSVVVPPDADPPLDEPELADRLVHRGDEIGKARVLPLGALTLGLKGERLAELAGLKKAGCVAFSQANKPVVDTEALLRAMEYAATFDFAVWLQPQDYWQSRNGIAHEGEVASRLGLAGILRCWRASSAADRKRHRLFQSTCPFLPALAYPGRPPGLVGCRCGWLGCHLFRPYAGWCRRQVAALWRSQAGCYRAGGTAAADAEVGRGGQDRSAYSAGTYHIGAGRRAWLAGWASGNRCDG